MKTTELAIAHHQIEPARQWMSRICGPHDLSTRQGGLLEFRHEAVRFPDLGTVIGRIRYGTDVTIGVRRGEHFESFSFSLPLVGRQSLHCAGEHHLSDVRRGLIVGPDSDQNLDMAEGCRKLQVIIPRKALHRVAENLLSRPVTQPIRFDPMMDLARPAVTAWWQMVRQTLEGWGHLAALCQMPAMAADLEMMLIKGLLLAQPNNLSPVLDPALASDCPDFVWRVERYLNQHLQDDIDLADIEVVAGVSRQKLYDAFHTWRGCTPLAYLKRRRLEAARQMILDSPRSGRTVASIALAWGFNHFGRFANGYKEAFGELPSETALRRREGEEMGDTRSRVVEGDSPKRRL